MIVITIPDTPPPPTRTHHSDDDIGPPPKLQPHQQEQQHQQQLRTAEKELTETAATLKATENKLMELQKVLQETKKEQDVLQNTHAFVQQDNTALKEANTKMQFDMRALYTTNCNLQGNYSTLWQSVATLQQENATLRASQGQQQQEDHHAMRDNYHALRKERVESHDTIQNLEKRYKTLCDVNRSLQRDQDAVRTSYSQLKFDYGMLHASMDTLQKNQMKDTRTVPPSNVTLVVMDKSPQPTAITSTEIQEPIQMQIQQLERKLRDQQNEHRDVMLKLKDVETNLQQEQSTLQDTTNQLQEVQLERNELNTTLQNERDARRDETFTLRRMEDALQLEQSQREQTQADYVDTQTVLQTTKDRLQEVEMLLNENNMTELDALKQERDRLAILYKNAVTELKSKHDTIESINAICNKKYKNLQSQQQRIVQERDEAVRLTEDMEIELHRLSKEVDHYEELLLERKLQAVPGRRRKKQKMQFC